ncbi:MAG: DUF5652 family protein [Patescibacteria group bacterium]|jgi:hypothetical protein
MYEYLTEHPLALLLFLVWSASWKGFALWRAAKADSRVWFIALFVMNTAGILEILYLFLFSKTTNTKTA